MRPSQRHPDLCSVGLILLVIIATSLMAQEASKGQQDSVLREVHLIITDRDGHTADDIKQDEIQVIEEGKPQTIDSFSMLDLPARYGLVIDTSGSLRLQFPKVIELAKGIVESKKPEDQVFIVRFIDSDRINKAQEMTSDKSQLLTALGMLRPAGQGQTALIDAVYISAQELLKPTGVDPEATHRKAIVLISDGEERQSLYNEDQLFKLLRKGNLKVFIIGLVQELDREGGFIRLAPRDRAIKLIEGLARETGGRAFFPKKPEDFTNVLMQIAHDLHLQYVIKYQSVSGAKRTNPKIEIKVSDGPGKRKRKAIFKT
jgi:Ca-activated chloride channel homolog